MNFTPVLGFLCTALWSAGYRNVLKVSILQALNRVHSVEFVYWFKYVVQLVRSSSKNKQKSFRALRNVGADHMTAFWLLVCISQTFTHSYTQTHAGNHGMPLSVLTDTLTWLKSALIFRSFSVCSRQVEGLSGEDTREIHKVEGHSFVAFTSGLPCCPCCMTSLTIIFAIFHAISS